MKRLVTFTLLAVLLVLKISYPTSVYADDRCSDILSGGIFNTVTINQSTTTQNDYVAWLCTTEFRTHQEAYDAGISIGFPVYGIPLKLGANFESAARDTWRKITVNQRPVTNNIPRHTKS